MPRCVTTTAAPGHLAKSVVPASVTALLDQLHHNPATPVVSWRSETVSGEQLRRAVLVAADRLRQVGVGAGSTVGVATSDNHPIMLVARYAAHLVGAAVTHVRSVNPRADVHPLSWVETRALLASTGASVVLTDEVDAGVIRDGLGHALGSPPVLALSLNPRAPAAPVFPPVHPDDTAVIAFTSGSTAAPKAIRLSFRAWDERVRRYQPSGAGRQPAVFLAVTPLHHTVATMIDAVLAGGGQAVLVDSFNPDEVLELVSRHQVTDTYMAVPHLYTLLDLSGAARTQLSPLRTLIYSGTPAAPHRVAEAAAALPGRVVQLYGSTECGGVANLTPLDHAEPELLGTVGRPLPWVEVRLCPEGKWGDRTGAAGEICVRSPTGMDGYLGEATPQEAPIGWVRTGDLAHWDRYGYLVLDGRVGSAIKTNGLRVFPESVEQALLSHTDVVEAIAYGTADADRVEEVRAAVRLRAGASCNEADLRAHVAALLSPLHAPVRVLFLAHLPTTSTGKPDRRRLQLTAANQASHRPVAAIAPENRL